MAGWSFEGVTPYHWLVVIIAAAGWLFDCMDQRIFVLARQYAVDELLRSDAEAMKNIQTYYGWATTWMILGWGAGGIIFGVLADRIGRVKTMVITLLIYSGFTGLCGLAWSYSSFVIFRFLTGLGVGGMFGAATSLVAESVPAGFRTFALGLLQSLSATGNMLGSATAFFIKPGTHELVGSLAGWRVLFFIGLLPALLAIPIVLFLREPEMWRQAKLRAKQGGAGAQVGSVVELFRHPVWRKHALVGLLFGVAGMIGLWGVGFFSPELIKEALQGLPAKRVDEVRAIGTLLQDFGSLLGMLSFTWLAARLGRKPSFAIFFIGAFGVTVFVFTCLKSATHAYWMLPMMGFMQLALFAGYSIYFPELFPTRLRATGVGFCYNTTRFLIAISPTVTGAFAASLGSFRKAAIVMSCFFFVGLLGLIWAPETKDRPLPED